MTYTAVGLFIPMYWLAEHCWTAQEWWKMFAFNGGLLMTAVLVNLFTSVCGGPKDAKSVADAREVLRKAALHKLTPEDREVLGL